MGLFMILCVALSLTYYYRTQFEDFYEANYRKYLKSTPQPQQEHTVTEQSYIMRCLQVQYSGNDQDALEISKYLSAPLVSLSYGDPLSW